MKPLYTPRFRLIDNTLVAFEWQLARRGRMTNVDCFEIIRAELAVPWLKEADALLKSTEAVTGRRIAVAIEVKAAHCVESFTPFLSALLPHLPDQSLQVFLNTQGFLLDCPQFQADFIGTLTILRQHHIACGITLWPNQLPGLNPIVPNVDLIKLSPGFMPAVLRDTALSAQFHDTLQLLNDQPITLVADGLYSQEEVSQAILMGIGCGQGFYFSHQLNN